MKLAKLARLRRADKEHEEQQQDLCGASSSLPFFVSFLPFVVMETLDDSCRSA